MRRGETLGRKGMSPLIATVLLMAFAVALGGMIMNITVDAGNKSGDCDLINVKVTQLCVKNDQILITMRNDQAGVALQGIKLNVKESTVESTLSIKDSALTPGQPLDIAVPAATTEDTRVDIIGVVGSDRNPVDCTATPIESVNPIKPC